MRSLGCGTWIRRRAGLARCAWAAAAVGLAATALQLGTRVTVMMAAVLVASVLVALAVARPRRSDIVPLVALACALAAGVVVGDLRIERLSHSPLSGAAGRLLTVEVVIEDALHRSGRYLSGPGRVVSVDGRSGEGGGVWLQMAVTDGRTGADGGDNAVVPAWGRGDALRVKGRVGLPVVRSSGFDQAAYLKRQGISLTLTAELEDTVRVGHRPGPAGWIDQLRARMCANLSLGVPATHAALLKGILLGLKEEIPSRTMDDFRRAGLSHLLTVSGSHIAWLLVLMSALGRGLRLPRALTLVLSVGILLLFVPLTDESPSVVRAAVVGGLMVASQLSGRRRDPWQLVFMAAALLMLSNPFMVLSPGFQLSFAAVAGILRWSGALSERFKALPSFVGEAAAVTLAASLATLPVALLQFGEAPLSSLPANLAVGPVAPLVTGLALAGSLAGLAAPWCAVLINFPAAVLVEWTCRVASLAGRAPLLGRGAVGPLAAAGVAAAAGLWFARRRAVRAAAPPGRAGLLIPLAAAVVGALLFFPIAGVYQAAELWRARLAWPAAGEIRILDVGQGSATLVRTPGGRAILIDAGPPGQQLAEQLRQLGVDRLDLVVISHAHLDHFGGLEELAGRVAVEAVVDPVENVGVDAVGSLSATPEGGTGGEAAELAAYLRARTSAVSADAVRHPADGVRLSLEGATLRFLPGASAEQGSAAGEDANARCLVVEVELGGIAILVPGDAEADILSGLQLTGADVMVIAHHGSKGAVTPDLLAKLGVNVAVISVGKENRFGHPHAETMALLEEAFVPAERTDQCGWVAVRPAGGGIEVIMERAEQPAEGTT